MSDAIPIGRLAGSQTLEALLTVVSNVIWRRTIHVAGIPFGDAIRLAIVVLLSRGWAREKKGSHPDDRKVDGPHD